MGKEWILEKIFNCHVNSKFPSKKYDKDFVRYGARSEGLGKSCTWQYDHDGVVIFFERYHVKSMITGEKSTVILKFKIVVDGVVIKDKD